MATKHGMYSDLPVPPGEYLVEVLEEKGISQAELARRIDRPTQAINEIVKGEKAITPATAIQLDRALGVPAHIWIGLESRFQLIKGRQEEERSLDKDRPYLKEIPYDQLADLACVRKTPDDKERIRELRGFYGVSSLPNLPSVRAYEASFRRGRGREASAYALGAWIRCAEVSAAKAAAEPFDKAKLRRALPVIRGLSSREPDIFLPELEKLLAACGVVLLLQPHFRKTYAHGATFWLGPEKAVLVMSLRGQWADIFWFSLFHELGHILLHKKKTYIDDGQIAPEMVRTEEEADAFASATLIEPKKYAEFVRNADFSDGAIKAFAEAQGVAVGIIIGRLQHDGILPNRSELNRLRTRYDWTAPRD
jgi:HTH-type transcriptional regulator / antitoxin HigA